MIGFSVDKAKTQFFDRAITNGMDKAKKKVLTTIGKFVRISAQRSIRTRKAASKPGSPPSAHGRRLLRKLIFYIYEPNSDGVIIGPMRLNQKLGNAPEALEKGGESVFLVGYRKGGQREKKTVDIKPRPYMKPAFDKEEPKFLAMWKDSVKG